MRIASRALAPAAVLILLPLLLAGFPDPYPLDGYDRTGIRRLEAYRLVQEGKLRGRKLPLGALLRDSQIRLLLAEINDTFDIGPDTHRDPYLQNGLDRIFAGLDQNYSIAMLDISDPTRPRYAGIRERHSYSPGSVGKLAVMVGLFAELARLLPDVQDRMRLLKETQIAADHFIVSDPHEVPITDIDEPTLRHRAIVIGDTFSLWEWLDHMVSPSSNAAASTVWKQLMLMNEFGHEFPVSPARDSIYFAETSPTQLQEVAVRVVNEPMRSAGLVEGEFRQGSFFTREGKRIVPRTHSHGTPLGLLRLLLKIEQGKLVDEWSSLEMKKLLYVTRRRIRYAAAPALDSAAVYFKSGSLYSCIPEPDYDCGQYRGNRLNFMNSVAIIESPAAGDNQRVYLVALMSNVLRQNSAADHAEIARRIERLVKRRPSE